MKEIIEADTGPMKKVLCLGATFAPTQQIMEGNHEGGATPQGNIWSKEGNHEGDH